MLLEGLHEACEVEQGAAEAIDFVDDHAIDLAGLDVGQEALQGGPVHVAAGEAAVVVAVGQQGPALSGLAADVGLGRFALGVEGVELLFEAFFGALAGVDGAAHQGQRGARPGSVVAVHRESPLWVRASWKKRKPLQCAPVMARATALRER